MLTADTIYFLSVSLDQSLLPQVFPQRDLVKLSRLHHLVLLALRPFLRFPRSLKALPPHLSSLSRHQVLALSMRLASVHLRI